MAASGSSSPTPSGYCSAVVICTASMQDRDGAKPVLLDTHLATPVRFVFADGAFAERLLGWAQTMLRTTLHIVRNPSGQHRFAVIPRRWAVERTLAWLTAHRRLARDYERDPAVSEAMTRWAAINTITRRIARDPPVKSAGVVCDGYRVIFLLLVRR
jgi:transposase